MTPPSSKSRPIIGGLAAVAAIVSGYLLILALKGTQAAECGPEGGCDDVLTSRWSYWMGLPVSAPAVVLYSAMVLAIVRARPTAPERTREAAWHFLAACAWLALLAAGWFVSLQLFVLKHLCPYCVAVHISGAAAGLLILRTTGHSLQIPLVRTAVLLAVALFAAGQWVKPAAVGSLKSIAPLSSPTSTSTSTHNASMDHRSKDNPATASVGGLRRELARQSRIVQAIGASSPDFIYAFDRDHRFIYASPPLLALWGKTVEEAIGRTFRELGYPPELVALHDSQLQTAFWGETVCGANSYVNHRGAEGYYEYTFVPVLGDDGLVETVVGTTRDVTARVLAERERQAVLAKLTASEAEFREFADAMPQLAWIARADGFIFWYNRHWYEYTGTAPEEMEGWGWQRVHDPETLPDVLERWKRSIQTQQPFQMTFPLRRADGVFRSFLTRGNPVRDEGGRVVRWFGTNTDIEDERRALQERDIALAAAADAIRVREEFLAIASHELRTPLTALLLQVQGVARLLEKQNASEALMERIGKANAAGVCLNELLSNLLDVSRLDAGHLRLEPEPIDLALLTQEVCSRQGDRAQRHLVFRAPEPVVGMWDPLRIGQVITNLVDNALKFGADQAVQVDVLRDGAKAIIRVADRGVGIAADRKKELFQRFSRAVADRHFGGFGLGLWIVKQIVDASGGTIQVESEEQKGTTIVVTLPLGNVAEGSVGPRLA